ncbi:MAG: hypothetical protein FWD89_01140 [Firmicutes bacterium]|nr:hypothetical protein [Bacillota bacterium]MCL2770898.1 hypothetical protein [Bacillota bacterium]
METEILKMPVVTQFSEKDIISLFIGLVKIIRNHEREKLEQKIRMLESALERANARLNKRKVRK